MVPAEEKGGMISDHIFLFYPPSWYLNLWLVNKLQCMASYDARVGVALFSLSKTLRGGCLYYVIIGLVLVIQ